jgi:hypothetical protein
MMRLVSGLVLIAALTNCAAAPQWARPGVDGASNQRDYETCRRQAYVEAQKRFAEATFPLRPGGEVARGANPIPAPMDRYGMSIGSDAGSIHRLEWQAERNQAYVYQQRLMVDCLAAAGFEPAPTRTR